MKIIAACFLFLILSTSAHAKYTPLDILPGLWEYTTDMSDNKMMKAALANVPAAQKEMVMKMMKQKMPKPVKNCMTKDELKDPEKQFSKGIAKNKNMKGCKLKVLKSSKKKFKGQMICPNNSQTFKIDITVKNNKEMDTVASGSMFGEVKSKAKWLSSKCSK